MVLGLGLGVWVLGPSLSSFEVPSPAMDPRIGASKGSPQAEMNSLGSRRRCISADISMSPVYEGVGFKG